MPFRPLHVASVSALMMLSALTIPLLAEPPAAGLQSARVERIHRYRMSGRIRPFLVWMGRDNVGLARVTWRDEAGHRGYDLLIGTDPGRAPRGINRWGFVSEQGTGEGGDLLALMAGSVVGSFAEANRDTADTASGARLRVLRGRLASGVTQGRVSQLVFPELPSVHDLDEVLTRLGYEEATAQPAVGRAAADARPGLLTALADLVEHLTAAAGRSDAALSDAARRRVAYVFGRESYALALRSAQRATVDGLAGGKIRAVEAEYEIVTASTNARTRFEMTTGLDGDLAGVPLSVRWQPRWWLEVGLHLEE